MRNIITFIVIAHVFTLVRLVERPPEDADLDFTALASKYGYTSKEYNVTTEDSYILTLHRIPGNKTKAVLLMHGFLDSSDTFILRGKKSLAAVLSNAGYDVWIGNCRGNKYSRKHKLLNPDKDSDFWDFSLHEMSVFDLRRFIDFILTENNATTLSLIGHSQGNTLFYILGSVIPDYNDKVRIAIALAPVAYFMPENLDIPLNFLFNIGPRFVEMVQSLEGEEIFGAKSLIKQFRENVCRRRGMGYMICAEGIFSLIGGEDLEELEPEFFQVLMGHYPTSASMKNLLHFFQIAQRREFAPLDHGLAMNMERYNSEFPPAYDLKKVTMNLALIAGKNDKMTPIKNVEILKSKLPNIVSYHIVDRPKYNHVDHIWGKHMDKYLYPHIFKLLEIYA